MDEPAQTIQPLLTKVSRQVDKKKPVKYGLKMNARLILNRWALVHVEMYMDSKLLEAH